MRKMMYGVWQASALGKTDSSNLTQLGWTPLHHAAAEGWLPVVKLLLQQPGVDATITSTHDHPLRMPRGSTALDVATVQRKAEAVSALRVHAATAGVRQGSTEHP